MVHVCRGACCPGGRSDSVLTAFRLLKAIVAPPVSTPAVNKYTKVDPVMRKVALMVSCYGLLRRVVAKKLGREAPREQDVQDTQVDLTSSELLDSVVGIPKDPRRHQKCVGKVRLLRVHELLSTGAAKLLTLVWLVVCSSVMRVHYRLFKHGTWFTHRKGIRCNVFEFSRRSPRSPVISSLSDIASMLLDPHREWKATSRACTVAIWRRLGLLATPLGHRARCLSFAGVRDALAENLSVL